MRRRPIADSGCGGAFAGSEIQAKSKSSQIRASSSKIRPNLAKENPWIALSTVIVFLKLSNG
jgi:hypothetical protein